MSVEQNGRSRQETLPELHRWSPCGVKPDWHITPGGREGVQVVPVQSSSRSPSQSSSRLLQVVHAERARWPALGHYPQLEDPAQVAATLDAFWR
jgi:pimeloyl-ACP methyl ester carboxylesterase